MISQNMIEKIHGCIVGQPGATTQDICDSIRCSVSSVQRGVKALIEAGRAKIILRDGYKYRYAPADGEGGPVLSVLKHTDAVLAYIKANPGATTAHIAIELRVTKQHAQRVARDFVQRGLITRIVRDDKGYGYALAVENKTQRAHRIWSESRWQNAHQRTSLQASALKLESQGLWRRASEQWLAVLDLTFDEKDRERIIQRRNDCIANCRYSAPAGYFA